MFHTHPHKTFSSLTPQTKEKMSLVVLCEQSYDISIRAFHSDIYVVHANGDKCSDFLRSAILHEPSTVHTTQILDFEMHHVTIAFWSQRIQRFQQRSRKDFNGFSNGHVTDFPAAPPCETKPASLQTAKNCESNHVFIVVIFPISTK
jgi:hypothetical protein